MAGLAGPHAVRCAGSGCRLANDRPSQSASRNACSRRVCRVGVRRTDDGRNRADMVRNHRRSASHDQPGRVRSRRIDWRAGCGTTELPCHLRAVCGNPIAPVAKHFWFRIRNRGCAVGSDCPWWSSTHRAVCGRCCGSAGDAQDCIRQRGNRVDRDTTCACVERLRDRSGLRRHSALWSISFRCCSGDEPNHAGNSASADVVGSTAGIICDAGTSNQNDYVRTICLCTIVLCKTVSPAGRFGSGGHRCHIGVPVVPERRSRSAWS